MLRVAFAREPLHVDVAADGFEALELMKAREYAVLLIDLMMPRLNGFELLQRLAHWSKRPLVFVLTAYDRTMTASLDPLMVHAIMRKPFDVETLVELVRECAAAMTSGAPARESCRQRSELTI